MKSFSCLLPTISIATAAIGFSSMFAPVSMAQTTQTTAQARRLDCAKPALSQTVELVTARAGYETQRTKEQREQIAALEQGLGSALSKLKALYHAKEIGSAAEVLQGLSFRNMFSLRDYRKTSELYRDLLEEFQILDNEKMIAEAQFREAADATPHPVEQDREIRKARLLLQELHERYVSQILSDLKVRCGSAQ